MHRRFLMLLMAAFPAAANGQQSCIHSASAPSLDRVVLVVPDLRQASATLAPYGFRFTTGYLHPDGLRSDHIRFKDGTELELMTVGGLLGDARAQDYSRLLAEGEGGAYVALTTTGLDAITAEAAHQKITYRRSAEGNRRSLHFPPPSGASGVFFAPRSSELADTDSVTVHLNGAVSLMQAWVEGGADLEGLLAEAGAANCGHLASPDGRIGQVWGLSHGSIVVVRPVSTTRPPRPIGAILVTAPGITPPAEIELPGFWIRFSR